MEFEWGEVIAEKQESNSPKNSKVAEDLRRKKFVQTKLKTVTLAESTTKDVIGQILDRVWKKVQERKAVAQEMVEVALDRVWQELDLAEAESTTFLNFAMSLYESDVSGILGDIVSKVATSTKPTQSQALRSSSTKLVRNGVKPIEVEMAKREIRGMKRKKFLQKDSQKCKTRKIDFYFKNSEQKTEHEASDLNLRVQSTPSQNFEPKEIETKQDKLFPIFSMKKKLSLSNTAYPSSKSKGAGRENM